MPDGGEVRSMNTLAIGLCEHEVLDEAHGNNDEGFPIWGRYGELLSPPTPFSYCDFDGICRNF